VKIEVEVKVKVKVTGHRSQRRSSGREPRVALAASRESLTFDIRYQIDPAFVLCAFFLFFFVFKS
jgi:hypothetical protein